jgi:hypothetical protein
MQDLSDKSGCFVAEGSRIEARPTLSRVHRTIASGGGHSFHNGRLAKFAWPRVVALTRWMSEMPATITAWVGTANNMARVTE